MGPAGPVGPVLPNAAVFVSVVTTGTNLDPKGYALTVLVGADTAKHVQVLPNDAVEFGGLALRDYAIILSGIQPNCTSDTLTKTLVPEAPELHSTTSFTISCFGPSVPPNSAGTQLLFVRQGKIYRTTIGSPSVTALTFGEEPTWSPDGTRIAFVRGLDTYVMDGNGANERVVATRSGPSRTSDFLSELAPAWSPDGSRLALFSDGTIAIVTVDSVAAARVKPPNSCYSDDEGSPTWSPDGKHVVFASSCYSSWAESSIIEVVSDTNGSSVLDFGAKLLYGIQPAWSPDGSSITFVAVDDYNSGDLLARIALLDPDGSYERTLVSSRGYSRLAWSPDGKTIAYANTCSDYKCPSAILYVTADGTRNGVLINDAHSPSWHN
ncbi:MAG: hypothetical protein ABI142_07125 [Bryocella sp.]